MKIVKGQPVNLRYPIVGRVLRDGGRLCLRKNAIYVSEQVKGGLWGYAAIVTGQSAQVDELPKGKPSVFGLSGEDIGFLQEGDVALLEPGGTVSVVWDADSPHNSIFITDSCNCK